MCRSRTVLVCRSTRVPDRRALVLADDQIALPVACLGAVLGLEGPLADGEHRLLEPRPASLSTLMSTAVITPGPQRRPAVRRQW
jgi:hypothetical protein